MTDYSKMSYDQLRKIADNDAIADRMSDEEYEALSSELWKKFGMEKLVSERYIPPAPISEKPERSDWQLAHRFQPRSGGIR
jgi:hypothetical protein